MKNVENLRHLEAELCLNYFTKSRYFILELLINLVLTIPDKMAKEKQKNKIYGKKESIIVLVSEFFGSFKCG